MKEIDDRIQALEKMMGKNMEYDRGLLEGISALEYIKEVLESEDEEWQD